MRPLRPLSPPFRRSFSPSYPSSKLVCSYLTRPAPAPLRPPLRPRPRMQTMSLATIGQSVRDQLKKASVIPDVIPDFTPSLLVNLTFPSNQTASLGNTISPSDTQEAPSIELHPSDKSVSESGSATYTLALTDPDAPSRDDPKWSEFCHWIITNVPLANVGTQNGNSGANGAAASVDTQTAAKGLKEIIEFYPPGPPPKTGKHRYIALVFQGDNTNLSAPGGRQRWGTDKVRGNAMEWAGNHSLKLVGANFFYAQNDKQ